jgi:1-acyl-sn-glycerol-3-phosphate acyltransferase
MKDGPYTGPLLYFREKSLELTIYRLSKVSYIPCTYIIKGLKYFLLINSLSSLFLVFFVQIKKGGKNIQFLPTKCLDSPTSLQ